MIRRNLKRIYRKIKGTMKGNPSNFNPADCNEQENLSKATPEEGALQELSQHSAEVEETEDIVLEVEAKSVHEWIEQGQEPILVDIRQPYELQSGYIPNAMLIPMNQLATQVDLFPKDRPIVLYCAAGARSFGMAHFMRDRGFENSWSLIGGVAEWNEFAYPISTAAFKLFEAVVYNSQTWIVWGVSKKEEGHVYRIRKKDSLLCETGITADRLQMSST